ncbi:MAG: phosphoribosylformylglycinamidine synthase subunit PurQ [Bacteroidota bacterium]
MRGGKARFGIVVFPGSNCDHDAYDACKRMMGQEAVFLWHKERDLKGSDVVVLPGGFSYGDYLRCGAIARFSPLMQEVVAFARDGGLVFGICNGFQILTEAGLLPGVLLRNASLRFVCRQVRLRVEHAGTPFTRACGEGEVLAMPVAHGEGNYFAGPEILASLEAEGRVLFRYCDADGRPAPAANPNGSAGNIAGITNPGGNVCGMMPHPERACDPLLHMTDGRKILASLIRSVVTHAAEEPPIPASCGRR